MMSRIRKFLLLTAIAGVGLAAGPATAAAAESVKIGAVLPLTGGLAPFGQASLRGIELAVEDINAKGGIKALDGARLEIVTGDAGSDPTTAASVAQRLISRDRVDTVHGAFASSLSIAVSQVTERARVPFLTMSFSDQLTGRGFRYLFQVVAKASDIGQAQLTYTREIAKAHGNPIENIAILYENSAYGSSQAEGLHAHAKELGVNVVLYEAYPHGINDATPLIQKILNADPQPDVIFPVSYFTDAVLIVRSLRQNDITLPVVGGAAGYIIPEFREALGEHVQGIFSADTSNYDHYGRLGRAYRERYGEFMTHEAFEHAVLVYAYAQAVERAGSTDSQKVAAALRSQVFEGYPFSGMPGNVVDFDETGLNVATYPIMVQWQDGELATVWPESDAKAKPIWP